MREEEIKKDIQNERTACLVRILIVIAVCFAIIFFIARYLLMISTVDGFSMFPTLLNGEQVLVDKGIYKRKEPERFDIVVFSFAAADTGYYIKRIIGLPGERIRIDDNGVIYINDKPLEEEYGSEQILEPGRARSEILLSDDEYFVLGDNRAHSEDSRYSLVGNIKRDTFLGKATLRIWPLSKYGYIDIYRQRTEKETDK